jgi:hypothetical protein
MPPTAKSSIWLVAKTSVEFLNHWIADNFRASNYRNDVLKKFSAMKLKQ